VSNAQWLLVGLAGLPLAAVVGVLLTWPVWTGARSGARLVPALLTVHTGAVVVGGTIATAAAVRSWQVVGEPEERAADALLDVSRIDGDTSLFALVVLLLVAATGLLGLLLAIATRFAASDHTVDRTIACAVLGLELGVCGLGLAWVAGGSRSPLALLAVVHLPILTAAMVACWPPHVGSQRHAAPRPQ
jgi:hypothetical protein